MSSLTSLFSPGAVALIGAAHTEIKLGGVVLKNLLKLRGTVYPVNPKYDELMGLKAYHTVKEIPVAVDLAVIMRPAPEVPEILRELEGKTKTAIVVSSGFAEVGEEGLQTEVKRIGRELGIRLLGPNCMGIFNPARRLDTFFISSTRMKRPKRGNVTILSQSGAVMASLFEAVRASHIGLSKAVGYGNALDIDESDLYEYMLNDRETDVVVSYIESLGDGRKFIAKAKELSRKKSLIILKSGKGESGSAAAYSHTGRLAGRYEVFRSILRQFGIMEAVDFDEMMDATKALSYQRASKGNRVCIITNGGGSGVLAADECMRQGLNIPRLAEEKLTRLKNVFPHFYVLNNPFDLTAQVRDEDYLTVLDEVKDDYDGFLVIALPNVMGITEGLAELMKDFKGRIQKPVVFHIPADGISRRIISHLEKTRIPVFPSPERAAKGLKALLGQDK
ncbi:MAG TPA: CoA-binding protein [Thermodesulfovibrionales bacterium]|nr:CoA-binding protein [Thermodesulfovibrionales bacterium]